MALRPGFTVRRRPDRVASEPAVVPRISEFYGIAVYMYWSDHAPPHFHAIYGEHEALVAIQDGSFVHGDLPRTAAHLVRQWLDVHREDLAENWDGTCQAL